MPRLEITAEAQRLLDVCQEALAAGIPIVAAVSAPSSLAVDLAGHARNGRLAALARRAAPVQLTWLDSLGTTGIDAMDFVLTDLVSLVRFALEQDDELVPYPELVGETGLHEYLLRKV